MPRGVFQTAMVGSTAALLAVVLVAGISQREQASVATAAPAATDDTAPEGDTVEPDPVPDDPSATDPGAAPEPDDLPPDDPAPDEPAPDDDPGPDDPAPDDPAPDDGAPDDGAPDGPSPDGPSQLSVVTSFGGITAEGGEVRFEITVTNRGSAPVAVEEADIQLVGPDGPLASVDGPDRGFEPAVLGARESASGSIVFDVPPGSEGLVLRVAPPDGQPVEIRL